VGEPNSQFQERERQQEQGLCFWASTGRVHPCTKQMVKKKRDNLVACDEVREDR